MHVEDISNRYHEIGSHLGLDLANAGYQPTKVVTTEAIQESKSSHEDCLILEDDEKNSYQQILELFENKTEKGKVSLIPKILRLGPKDKKLRFIKIIGELTALKE